MTRLLPIAIIIYAAGLLICGTYAFANLPGIFPDELRFVAAFAAVCAVECCVVAALDRKMLPEHIRVGVALCVLWTAGGAVIRITEPAVVVAANLYSSRVTSDSARATKRDVRLDAKH